jgi:hypothetical protein
MEYLRDDSKMLDHKSKSRNGSRMSARDRTFWNDVKRIVACPGAAGGRMVLQRGLQCPACW